MSLWNQLPIFEIKSEYCFFSCIKNTKDLYNDINNAAYELGVLNFLYFAVFLKIDICHFCILKNKEKI